MGKTCLDCGEPLVGRADKKFCCDQCRNNYNNHLNSESSLMVRQVNNILRRNRRILNNLVPIEKTTVHKEKLSSLGFNFNYFTHIYTTQKEIPTGLYMNMDTFPLKMISICLLSGIRNSRLICCYVHLGNI